eukprot:CAMPEP_0113620500 /NCGR_PEP_ID=MMETSP0017_2-20120614/10450_1 /TAXON_ID=2856 /ORGANISM="Cylindrotheca closterium" /LENGTH=193 /DNA_ID=CAMNT_0000530173 /DNA_START=116 /DNA_END=697 /DNA_ORIENTATION=+ /assembly_acc=CAM_ASM_000147
MTKNMRPRSASDSRIRDNLIFKLGVVSPVQKPMRSQISLLGNVQVSSEPLKSGLDEDELESSNIHTVIESQGWKLSALFSKSLTDLSSLPSEPTESCSETSSITNRRLTFNESVTVCPIPKHEAYSKRMKEQLWHTPEEMVTNARRNSIEFAAEGWDWRNTLEDENMYRCVNSNEKIHPVHVQNYQQQLERQS